MGKPVMRAAALAGLLLAVALVGSVRHASQVQACGEFGPYNFDTYEAEANVTVYNVALEAAARGALVSNAWVVNGEVVDLTYQGLQTGPRDARTAENKAVGAPPSILKAIAWIEAKWQNASSSVPWGGVGPTIRSFDCGYGLGQVTSGMANQTGAPSARQALIGTHFMFNLAESMRILASKWNSPARPIAGQGNPAILEDWYYAIWSYNGFASSNHTLWNSDQEAGWIQHPLNPWRDPLRGEVYHCDDPAAPNYADVGNGDPLLRAGDFTYPERIYGCMRYPPRYTPKTDELVNEPPVQFPHSGAATQTQEAATPTVGGGPSATPTPTTDPAASPTPTPKTPPPPYPTATPTGGSNSSSQVVAAATDDWLTPDAEGRIRMWQPVEFVMPDLTIPVVSAAFAPEAFMACYNNNFAAGCPGMDFPTKIDEFGVVPHTDPTPLVSAQVIAALFGAPQLTFNGETSSTILVDDDGFSSKALVSVSNSGSWIAPFRIRTSAPWIRVRHPGDEPDRILNGSIAVGRDVQVITQAATNNAPPVTSVGHTSVLEISVDAATVPGGTTSGAVWIEPLFGGGNVIQISLTIGHGEVDPGAGSIPTPTAGTSPSGFPYRAVVPGISTAP